MDSYSSTSFSPSPVPVCFRVLWHDENKATYDLKMDLHAQITGFIYMHRLQVSTPTQTVSRPVCHTV